MNGLYVPPDKFNKHNTSKSKLPINDNGTNAFVCSSKRPAIFLAKGVAPMTAIMIISTNIGVIQRIARLI